MIYSRKSILYLLLFCLLSFLSLGALAFMAVYLLYFLPGLGGVSFSWDAAFVLLMIGFLASLGGLVYGWRGWILAKNHRLIARSLSCGLWCGVITFLVLKYVAG